MNTSISLQSSFAINPLLVPQITDMTILYSHKVFNGYLNYKHKVTKVTGNTLAMCSFLTDHTGVRHSPLYYVFLLIYTFDVHLYAI